MAIIRYDMPAIDEIRNIDNWKVHRARRTVNEKLLINATDSIITCDDVDDLATVFKRTDAASPRFCQRLRNGDASQVHLANEWLDKMREHIVIGRSHVVRDDVEGSLPNVPAFLAGVPYNMRRRHRVVSVKAPMCLFLELTASSGVNMGPRAAMLYALAQVLSEVRPIQLWAMLTWGGSECGPNAIPRLQMHAVRLDTSPFDVARICNVLMHPDELASASVIASKREMGHWSGGSSGWAYGVPSLEQKWSGEILRRIVHPSSTILHVPATHLADPHSDKAAEWLKVTLAKYAGDVVSQEDAA